jgi:hypothetical protein
MTKRPVETFDNEPDDPADWGPNSHGLSGEMAPGQDE